MARRLSVRELRNHTADVVRALEAGETFTLTVSGREVADIVPHARRIDQMPARLLAEELARLPRGATELWPADEETTDDPITGLGGG